jgi:hypothetical protein
MEHFKLAPEIAAALRRCADRVAGERGDKRALVDVGARELRKNPAAINDQAAIREMNQFVLRLLYLVSRTVLALADCILLTAASRANFIWQKASPHWSTEGTQTSCWRDHVPLDKRERLMAKKPHALDERR